MCQGGDHSKKGIYRGDHTIAVTHARTWKVQTLRSKRMGPPNQIRPYVLESSRTINPYEKNFPISTISYIYIYIQYQTYIWVKEKSRQELWAKLFLEAKLWACSWNKSQSWNPETSTKNSQFFLVNFVNTLKLDTHKVVPQFGIAKLVNITPFSLWFMADITN